MPVASADAAERLFEILRIRPQITAPASPRPLPAPPRGDVSFENVRFSYPTRPDASAVDGISFTVRAGEKVAIVGPSGAGKSTLFHLLLRFYDPAAGTISVDGVPIRTADPREVLSRIALVPQESVAFAASARENIRFGRPDATMEEVVAATKALGAHDFISAMPDGYDTDVANSAGRLSAGQRQLVAFARAFLADPAVLILDEATSSLDVPSERLVQQALRTVLAGRTAVIIAHRLSTVEIADRVLVMEHGRIVEDGSPAELIAGGDGRYSDLHKAWLESLA